MYQYKLLLYHNDVEHDITDLSGNIGWSDSVDSLGMQLNFDFARNRLDPNMAKRDVLSIGDMLVFRNGESILFEGVNTNVVWERFKKSVTAFDFAYYLNQSKTMVQFRKIKGSVAIKQLLDKFNVPIGEIADIPVLITKIFKSNTVAEIIKYILQKATQELGIEYRLEMRGGKIFIQPYEDLIITAKFYPPGGETELDIVEYMGIPTKTESLNEMRNAITVTTSDEKTAVVHAAVEDEVSINTYGRLEDVILIDKKNKAEAYNVAKNELRRKNNFGEEVTLQLLGNDTVRSGRILIITNDEFDMDGMYLIKNCSKKFVKGIPVMDVTLKKKVS